MNTKQRHTEEPWMILDEGDVIEIFNGDTGVTATSFDSSRDTKRVQVLADYDRIVACVNYCKGITNERIDSDMEQGVNANDQIEAFERDRAKLNDLEDQRDDLLTLSKQVLAEIDARSEGRLKGNSLFVRTCDAMRELIAKAEQS